jgi:hypothetical protein
LDFRNRFLLSKKLTKGARPAAALDECTCFGAVQFAKHLCPCFCGCEDQRFQEITHAAIV